MSSLPDAKVLDEPTELLAFTRSSRAADVAVHAMAMKQTRRDKQNKSALKTLPAIHKRGEVLVGPSALHKRQSPLAPKERTNEGNVTGASKGNFKGNGSCFTYSLREKEIGKRNWKDISESIEVLLLALIFYSILF
jgi:hypothetical protein